MEKRYINRRIWIFCHAKLCINCIERQLVIRVRRVLNVREFSFSLTRTLLT